jgi:hypothetical protein
MNGVNAALVRAVTHYDVTSEDCEEALDAIRQTVVRPGEACRINPIK